MYTPDFLVAKAPKFCSYTQDARVVSLTSPRASYCYSFRHFHFILKSEFQNHSLIWPNKTNTPNNVQHRESSSFLIILSVCELLAFVEMYRLMLERNPCENLKKKKEKGLHLCRVEPRK